MELMETDHCDEFSENLQLIIHSTPYNVRQNSKRKNNDKIPLLSSNNSVHIRNFKSTNFGNKCKNRSDDGKIYKSCPDEYENIKPKPQNEVKSKILILGHTFQKLKKSSFSEESCIDDSRMTRSKTGGTGDQSLSDFVDKINNTVSYEDFMIENFINIKQEAKTDFDNSDLSMKREMSTPIDIGNKSGFESVFDSVKSEKEAASINNKTINKGHRKRKRARIVMPKKKIRKTTLNTRMSKSPKKEIATNSPNKRSVSSENRKLACFTTTNTSEIPGNNKIKKKRRRKNYVRECHYKTEKEEIKNIVVSENYQPTGWVGFPATFKKRKRKSLTGNNRKSDNGDYKSAPHQENDSEEENRDEILNNHSIHSLKECFGL